MHVWFNYKTDSVMWWWNLPWAGPSPNGEQTEVDRGSQTRPEHDCGFLAQLVSKACSLVILYNWERNENQQSYETIRRNMGEVESSCSASSHKTALSHVEPHDLQECTTYPLELISHDFTLHSPPWRKNKHVIIFPFKLLICLLSWSRHFN